ncbi:hypothetical protein ABGB14_01790 [Nonomuraea sp. B10E15]|uniref:hypothetical protein n=1 Tax=Nonomuraea sp. B10E15 TaxID=3153560 RepID=UPI00325EE358
MHTPAPLTQPIVDSSPYVCRLIPEQAFRLVSGATKVLAEKAAGDEKSGECWAPDMTPHPLEVGWLQVGGGTSQEHLDFVMNDRRQIYSRHGGHTLPEDLGSGMAVYMPKSVFAEQPYQVSAKFRCGGKDRMIDIYLARVAKGRDGIKDLVELMRIAQKRYGELYDCTPGT